MNNTTITMKKTIALLFLYMINGFINMQLFSQSGLVQLGQPNTVLSYTASPVGAGSTFVRTQYKLRVSELVSANFLRASWTEIQLHFQGNAVFPIQIYIKPYSSTVDTGIVFMSFSNQVFQGYLSQDSSGWSRFHFQNNFNWDGVQDVIIQFCIGIDTVGGSGLFSGDYIGDLSGFRLEQSTPIDCAQELPALSIQYRPAMKIVQQVQIPSADSILYFPYNGFRGMPTMGARLQWQDGQAAGPVTQYELILDTINPPNRRIALLSGIVDSYQVDSMIPSQTYYWKVIPHNPSGSDSFGIVNEFTTQATYCTPPILFSGGSKLSSCRINSEMFYSGDTCTQYVLHSDTLLLTVGDSLRLEAHRISCSSYRNWYLTIGLDRNLDGDFQDVGEILYSSSTISTNSQEAVCAIPSFSGIGFTRLRVQISEAAFSGNACQAITYGEIEDFQVRSVLPAIPQCSPNPCSLNGIADICPETPQIILSSGAGSITHYLIQLDTSSLFNNPDSFIFSSSMSTHRFPDTLQQGRTYYYRSIPIGPGGYALGCSTESFSTAVSSCTDTICADQVLFPANNQSGIYPVTIPLSWMPIGGILADSIRIVWDTLSPPAQFRSTFFSGTLTSQQLFFPSENQVIYWKPELKNRNGILRNCSNVFSFITRSLPCKPLYSVGNQAGDYISRVSIGNQTRLSGASQNPDAFEQIDSVIFQVQAGTSITLIVSPGSYPSGNHLAAWIDFNRNGTWEPNERLGEILIQAPGPSSDTIHFIVPACADTGYTLLRIREAWGIENMDPCAEYPYGEVEDYSIHIRAPHPTPPLCPDSITPNTLVTSISYLGDSLRWSFPIVGSCPISAYVFLGTDNPPSNIFNAMNTGSTTNLFINNLQPNSQYFWKVVSENAHGQSFNCAINSFKTCPVSVPPLLLSPTGIGCDRATLIYQPVSGISTYQVQIAQDSLFMILHPTYACSTLNHTDRIALVGLSGSSTWFGRIRSITDCDTGLWSTYQVIQLIIPPSAVIQNPAQLGTCKEIQINWQNTPGALSYELDISLDSTFQSFLTGYNQRNVLNNTTLWVDGLRASRSYYVRIRAGNLCGWGVWSATSQYFTAADQWIGIDSLWNYPWNWCSGFVPDSLTDVSIQATHPTQPIIAGNAYCRNLQIDPGARLCQLQFDTLSVFGNWNSQGSFHPGMGTVYFKSNTPQFFFGRDTFNNINIYNIAGVQIDTHSLMQVTGFLTPVLGYLETNSNLELLMDSLKFSGILRSYSPLSGIRGEVRMKQIFSRTAGNRLLASPFTNTAVGEWWNALGGYTDAYRYVEYAMGPQQHGFQIMYDSTDTLENARGYYVTTLGNTQLSMHGNTRSGTINYPVTWTVDPLYRSASGWNLIGNPYLCPINWNATSGWQRSAISNAVFYLDPASGQQVGYINGVGTLGAGPIIGPGQGFWVKATGINASLVLDERAKVAHSGKFFREAQEFHGYRIQLKREANIIAESLIRKIPESTIAFDPEWDAEYPGPLAKVYAPQLWLNYEDSLNFVIQSVDKDLLETPCKICVDLPIPGKWEIQIETVQVGQPMVLEQQIHRDNPDGLIIDGKFIQNDHPIQICPWKLSSFKSVNQEYLQQINPSVVVFPNPCIAGTPIKWKLKNWYPVIYDDLVLTIFDNLGRKLKCQKVTKFDGILDDWVIHQPGVYHIQFVGEKLNLSTSFMIIANHE